MLSQDNVIRVLLVVVIAAALVPGTSPGAALARAGSDATGGFEPAACWFSIPAGFAEGEDVVCGYVTVPERHADPDGPAIRLAVAVIKSTGDHPAPDPLVVESGGPGVSSLLSVPSLLGVDLFREARDLVIVEQRGIGDSQPSLVCEPGERLIRAMYGKNPPLDEVFALEESVLTACVTDWQARGIDLSAYNSVENAADFPLVMDALGYDTFNFYGISYASALAQHLMRDYPARLRSVVLDAVVPLQADFVEMSPLTADRAFRKLFTRCAADPVCGERFPDLEAVFYDLVAQYNAAPVTMTLDDPWGDGTLDAVITGNDLVMALYLQLYWTATIPLLPASIYALADGNPHFVENYVSPSRFGGLRVTSGMSNSVMCMEFVGEDYPAFQAEGVPPVVAEALLTYMDYRHICGLWGVDLLPAALREPVQSDIPVLLLSGEFDPITPPENGDVVADLLSHSFSYTFPGVGHGALRSGACALSIMQDFLDDPAREPDASCMEMFTLTFAPSLDVFAITLEPVTVAEYGIRTVIPQGWTEMEPGTYGSPGTAAIIGFYKMPDWDTARRTFGTGEPGGSFDVGDRVWTAYDVALQGYTGVVVITDAPGGGVYVAGALSTSADGLAQLIDAALVPGLEALEPVD